MSKPIGTKSPSSTPRCANAKVGKFGNKIIFQGAIQPNVYERDGAKFYKTTLAAFDFDVLAFAKDKD